MTPWTTVDARELAAVVAWLRPIPWEAWPQQGRIVPHVIRPAMVSDPAWHDFKSRTYTIVAQLMARFTDQHGPVAERNRLLSVVMPDATIAPHVDPVAPSWRCRIHVPITTHPDAWLIQSGETHHLRAGCAYLVDVTERHAVWNAGPIPRVHLMFDVFDA